jgi:hypothetical protein
MTRDQMVAEFGEPGVENARMVDLITRDAAADRVVLVMIERRPWGPDARDLARQFSQIEEKINRYLGYVLDGFLVQQYPQYEGKAVRIRLDCAEAPQGEAARFVAAATAAVAAQGHGLELVVNVTQGALGPTSAGVSGP